MEVMAGKLKSSLGTLEKNSLAKKSINTLLHLMSKAAFFSYPGKGTFLGPPVPQSLQHQLTSCLSGGVERLRSLTLGLRGTGKS